MPTIAEFIAEVRTWIDTPFAHAGRIKGVGVDCVGILAGAGKACGIIDYDNVNYSPKTVDSALLVSELSRFSDIVPIKDRKPGDILLLAIRGNAQHTGVLTTHNTFVHAYASAGKVCESSLEPHFIRSLVAVFRIKAELCS